MLTAFDHGRLFGERSGTGEPWVLALHGWRRTHRDFAVVLDGLDAIALDLPGFGASPPPPEAWGGSEYAKAVVPVVETMAAPVVVLGHSFGGRAAVHLAAARPDLVRALVLTGVPLLRPPDAPAARPALAFRVARVLHRRRLISDDRMEQYRQKFGSEDYRLATGVMRSVHVRAVNETYEEPLRRLTCPVELVWGDDDTAAPLAVAESAAALLTDVRLTVVPGAGHLTPLTAPAELAAAIERHRP
jgi:pimeloyl-ACP methyl ester carboxylesterase